MKGVHNFNFIMILFYWLRVQNNVYTPSKFQFHYDLILFMLPVMLFLLLKKFQFHYDLILFLKYIFQHVQKLKFQFHYDLILLYMQ